MRIMKKLTLIATCVALLMTSCVNEYNQITKSGDYTLKYEYAKQCYAQGKYSRAVPLLQEVVTMKKGSTEGEECLYMLAMAEFGMKDYETASEYFKKYFSSYPKGRYAENAKYYVGESLFQNAPEPRLDQSTTMTAIAAFQEYLDIFPDAHLKSQATSRLYALLSGRKDVIVVSSVSCIYGMGGPVAMQENIIKIKKGQTLDRNEFLRKLVDALYVRNDIELQRGNFRVKGETVDIFMAYSDNVLRVTWWDDEIDSIEEVDSMTYHRLASFETYEIYPANLFVTTKEQQESAIRMIQDDMVKQEEFFKSIGD